MHAPRARDPDKLAECRPVPGSEGEVPVATRVALFHYVTRSEEDFRRKQARGGGQNRDAKPWTYFEAISKCVSRAVLTK